MWHSNRYQACSLIVTRKPYRLMPAPFFRSDLGGDSRDHFWERGNRRSSGSRLSGAGSRAAGATEVLQSGAGGVIWPSSSGLRLSAATARCLLRIRPGSGRSPARPLLPATYLRARLWQSSLPCAGVWAACREDLWRIRSSGSFPVRKL